jgi:predicted nuclease of predicted toxin-antitoxin system
VALPGTKRLARQASIMILLKYSEENQKKMQSKWESKGEKLHTRDIQVTTYAYDEQRIIIEGSLKDDRFVQSYSFTGEKFFSGVIHHMIIRLLVNCSNLVIEDVDVEMKSVPREVCRETINCLEPIKGLIITKGFTAKVKKIAGGKRGCTHLVELIQTMAPTAIQGFAAYRSRKPTVYDPDRAKMILAFLVDTCRIWREDGPLIEMFKKNLHIK